MTSINLSELKTALNTVIDHLRSTNEIETVELEENFYWKVSEADYYATHLESTKVGLVIGSLSDDWEFTGYLAKKDPDPVSYQLIELAPIINAIGLLASKKGLL